MTNKKKDMREVKKIFRLYSQGTSKRGISEHLGISRKNIIVSIPMVPALSI